MTKEEFLEQQILLKYKSVMAFSKAIDIPYTTIKGILSRGIDGAAVQTILKICANLNLNVEALINAKFQATISSTIEKDVDLKELIDSYETMNVAGRKELIKYSRLLLKDNQYLACGQSDLGETA